MFQLDDKFLEDIGLADLPEEQKKPFLQHIYEQLEYQVGISLSDGMTDEQLEEFESIIDRKPEAVDTWLQTAMPQFAQDPAYATMQQAMGPNASEADLKAEFASAKWLEVNRPDYRDVVAKTLESLKQEVIQSRDAILGGSPQA